jgi:hypothetical protein
MTPGANFNKKQAETENEGILASERHVVQNCANKSEMSPSPLLSLLLSFSYTFPESLLLLVV